ncbi:MAG: phytanoyl-CoA dioxygenase family protein [Fimbriimonadaceae bacterium]|nr:phytanoyl-CoA dioxygenase family protein [Fimbriimonadaceae bacterium]
MSLSPQEVAQYQQDGYLILPDLLTAAECAAAIAALDELLADLRAAAAAGQPAPALQQGVFVGLSMRSELFRQLARSPRLLDPLEAIWGPDLGFLSDKLVFKDGDVEFGSPWHADWPYWQGAHKISIWIALDEATPDNGCLLLVPGSHRHNFPHDQITDAATRGAFGNRLDITKLGLDREPLTAPLAAGSAVLFHDLTLHASLPNRNGRPRRALIETYRNLAEPDLDYPSLPAAARVRGG